MKIAHIITRLIRGGADENTLLSCNAQAAEGHEVHLIYGNTVSEDMIKRLHGSVISHQVKSLRRPVSPLSDAQATVAMARLFRRIRPDIVHTHTSKAGFVGRLAAKLAGAQAIVHGVHILPFLNVGRMERLVYLFAERTMAKFTDAFVNVSAGMRDLCLQHHIGDADSHYIVPSGMDIHAFLNAEPLDDIALSTVVPDAATGRVRIVLMVAALEARKRIVEFLDVFSRIVQTEPDVKLVILGEGIDRSRIEQAINEKGLAGAVFLAGFRTDVERWIARSHVCVLSSEREGLPRAVVQYAAGACPCVVTNLPGVDVVVKHGITGYLVDCDKVDEMASPIIRILGDTALAESMRKRSRELNLLPWSVQNMTDQLDYIYKKVAAQK